MSSTLLTDLIELLVTAWPEIVKTAVVTVNGLDTSLDPLALHDSVGGGGGPCPWACGTVSIGTVHGLAGITMDAAAATFFIRSCDPLGLVLSIPMLLPQLTIDTTAHTTFLGMPINLSPGVTIRNIRGTMTATVPIAPGAVADTFVVSPSGIQVRLYLDVQDVAAVTGVPGPAVPVANDLLQAGLAPLFARLASGKLSDLLTHLMASKTAKIPALTLQAWELPGIDAPPASPQACTRRGQPFTTPCDPCDKCCECATQGRCADADCMALCGACMPAECTPGFPPTLIIAAVVLSLLILALLVSLGFGVYAAGRAAVRVAMSSKGSVGAAAPIQAAAAIVNST